MAKQNTSDDTIRCPVCLPALSKVMMTLPNASLWFRKKYYSNIIKECFMVESPSKQQWVNFKRKSWGQSCRTWGQYLQLLSPTEPGHRPLYPFLRTSQFSSKCHYLLVSFNLCQTSIATFTYPPCPKLTVWKLYPSSQVSKPKSGHITLWITCLLKKRQSHAKDNLSFPHVYLKVILGTLSFVS